MDIQCNTVVHNQQHSWVNHMQKIHALQDRAAIGYSNQSTSAQHNRLLIYQHMVTKVKSAVTKLTVMLGLKSGKVIYCVKLDTPYFKPNNKHRLYRQHQDITGPLCSITDML
ncbi:hypothetical protein QVD99_005601 [Batrachochytrium dendrobatidis]|nr:hypothetical protein QVD99_005601 [Batrachochytrium dendrobatidis]